MYQLCAEYLRSGSMFLDVNFNFTHKHLTIVFLTVLLTFTAGRKNQIAHSAKCEHGLKTEVIYEHYKFAYEASDLFEGHV